MWHDCLKDSHYKVINYNKKNMYTCSNESINEHKYTLLDRLSLNEIIINQISIQCQKVSLQHEKTVKQVTL